MTLPFTPDRSCPLPPVRAQLGNEPAHFIVEEIPAYPLSDSGEHVFFWIEKCELNTLDVAKRLAQATGTRERDIGYAGMKDKHAVTRQWFSVLYKADDAAGLDLGPGVIILSVRRHNNKLRTGHLIGNRFIITLVGADDEDKARATAITQYIHKHGVANHYGGQRFGHRGKNLEVALVWLREQAALKEQTTRATGQGDSAETDDARGGRRRDRGRKKTSRFDNKLHPSVIQSEFFNRYVSARLSMPDELLLGEVVRLNNTGTHFVVQDLAAELPRKLGGDLILTGSMPGPKTLQSQYAASDLEQAVWNDMGLAENLLQELYQHAPGARRDLKITPDELSLTIEQDQIVLTFALPAGGYATQLIREFNDVDWLNPRNTRAQPLLTAAHETPK